MDELVAEATRGRVLEPDGYRLAWRVLPPERFDAVLWPVITDATDLLVSEAMGRLRRCGECDWLFVDQSRNRRRRWCKKACGDRVKSRRYQARRREARDDR
jgi:predicted RNA-binding Zn ribbon-like protein